MSAPRARFTVPTVPALVALGALVLCVLGWALFWSLTDDAFIAFRYVSNRQLGHGYVWNAAPWLPVEGYTSFLWLLLLDLVWTLTGVAPPEAANVLSLLASLATVLLFARATWALLPAHSPRGRVAVFALALLGLVTHRVFLTWTSSGLETALFNLLLFAWLLVAWAGGPVRWPLAALAALLSLARPDGYLFVLATLVLFAREALTRPRRLSRLALHAAPLLVVAGHLLWRRSFYGEWLPNTYFAKSVGPLPTQGAFFLAQFLVEHALWLWFALYAAALWRSRAWRHTHGAALVAGGAVVLHVLYYSVMTGGDHFEYRVLSHLVPPLLIGLSWACTRLFPRPLPAAGALLAALLLSGALPWLQWQRNLALESWAPEIRVFPLAEALPAVLSPYGRLYDALEARNAAHFVAMRHQHHKVFCEHQLAWVPPRAQGAALFGDEPNPVVLTTGAGVTGWSFPTAHVLDFYGLNDYVIARTRPLAPNRDIVAHARRPPPGYVEAFRPNLTVTPTSLSPLSRREPPLRDEDIVAIETAFRAALPADRNEPVPVPFHTVPPGP